ncbi:MAG: molybdopterin-dependent oxidoreductase, partial [Akkermansiaceae bacterium]
FQMRVWFLKETKSIDVNCGTGANTIIWTRGNEIFRVTPRQNDEVNSAWMPDSHRLAFNQLQTDDRLTSPMVKKGRKHEETSWLEATAKAAEVLARQQPGEVAVIASGRLSNEEIFLASKISGALGTELLSIVPRMKESDGKLISADRNPNTTGASLIWGTDDPGAKLDAIRAGISSGKIKALLCLGEDLLEEADFKKEDLKKLDDLVVSHTHANPTASLARVVLPSVGFAEKRATYVNVTGRLQRTNQAVIAPGEVRDDWESLAALLAKLDPEYEVPASMDGVLRAISTETKAFAGQTFGSIGDLGVQITETGVTIPLLEKERARIESGQIVG